MSKFFSKRHLKIAEQIIIVIVFAVIVPFFICGLIVNNVNQQAVRAHLRESAITTANIISEEFDVFQNSLDNELSQICFTLNYYNSPEVAQQYLDTLLIDMPIYKQLKIVPEWRLKEFDKYSLENDSVVYNRKLKNNIYLVAVLDVKVLKRKIFNALNQEKKQIYVLRATDKKLLGAVNFDDKIYKKSLAELPKELRSDESVVIGKIKNQPLVYHQKSNPNVIILVNTTRDMTKNTIEYNRNKIIISLLVTMLTIFLVVGLYTSYLYINIRQLFKAIIAISKGN